MIEFVHHYFVQYFWQMLLEINQLFYINSTFIPIVPDFRLIVDCALTPGATGAFPASVFIHPVDTAPLLVPYSEAASLTSLFKPFCIELLASTKKNNARQ